MKNVQKTGCPKFGLRADSGMYLVEVLIASLIAMGILVGVLSTTSALYTAASTNRNHVLATDIAQALIDNARNCSYGDLLTAIGPGNSVSQELPLYTYPSDPSTALFPRPLLRNDDQNSGMTHSTSTQNSKFNGTVTETLTNLTPNNTSNGIVEVAVNVHWTDSTGNHDYNLDTRISQNGVHN